MNIDEKGFGLYGLRGLNKFQVTVYKLGMQTTNCDKPSPGVTTQRKQNPIQLQHCISGQNGIEQTKKTYEIQKSNSIISGTFFLRDLRPCTFRSALAYLRLEGDLHCCTAL